MSWFLKKIDNTVYGPVDMGTLKAWAADGRVHPDDRLSQDEIHWKPAPEVSELDMEWMVDLPSGKSYGPVHVLALRDLIREGTAKPDSRLMHVKTRQAVRAGDELLKALTEQYDGVLQDLAAQDARVAELEAKLAEAAPRPAIVVPASGNVDEIAPLLAAKNAEIEEAYASRAKIEKEARERMRQLEERADLADKESEAARRRLAELEAAHVQLVREHREMNDRYIALREASQPSG